VTNVLIFLIFLVAIIIACGGLLAIRDGVINEYRRRASLQYLRVSRGEAFTAEIEAWLRDQ
jgi:hypothetical protein